MQKEDRKLISMLQPTGYAVDIWHKLGMLWLLDSVAEHN